MREVLDSIDRAITKGGVTTVVAHNLAFDMRMLDQEYTRLKRHFPLATLARHCTMQAARRQWPGQSARLGDVEERLCGARSHDLHDALTDVRACAAVFFALSGHDLLFASPAHAQRRATPASTPAVAQRTPEQAKQARPPHAQAKPVPTPQPRPATASVSPPALAAPAHPASSVRNAPVPVAPVTRPAPVTTAIRAPKPPARPLPEVVAARPAGRDPIGWVLGSLAAVAIGVLLVVAGEPKSASAPQTAWPVAAAGSHPTGHLANAPRLDVAPPAAALPRADGRLPRIATPGEFLDVLQPCQVGRQAAYDRRCVGQQLAARALVLSQQDAAFLAHASR